MRTLTIRVRAAALVLPVVLLASAACDIAIADNKEKETAQWQKTYQIEPGGRVEIGNINGKIDVSLSQGNAVEVFAEKIAHGPSREAAREALGRIEIREEASASGVKIETKHQRGSSGLFSGGNLSVRYTVRVPSNVELRVSTVNGGVEITGVAGRVTAAATNGGIRARDLAGAIEASTTNGGVDVDLAKVAAGGVKLETTNGGIRLRLPADAKASISARISNGGIDAGGLALETVGESTRRRLDARLNGGGPRIELEGTNGGIRISSR